MDVLTEASIAAYLKADETAAEFITRYQAEKIICGFPLIDDNIQIRPGHVIELTGGPGTGKTEVLVQIIAAAITKGLSTIHQPEDIICFDLDGKFDLLRLLQVLTPKVQAAHAARIQAGLNSDTDQLLEGCLQCFHLVRCCNSFEYLTSILSLDAWLTQHQGHCRLLLIDTVNSFFWADKAAKSSPLMVQGPSRDPPLSLHRVHTAAATFLTALCQKHRLAVVASRGTVVDLKEEGEGGAMALHQRESMPTPWQNAVVGRLVMRIEEGGEGSHREGRNKVLVQWQGKKTSTVQRFFIHQAGIAVDNNLRTAT